MRGFYTPVTKIRRQIFKKVAELAYSGNYAHVDELPYEIKASSRSAPSWPNGSGWPAA